MSLVCAQAFWSAPLPIDRDALCDKCLIMPIISVARMSKRITMGIRND